MTTDGGAKGQILVSDLGILVHRSPSCGRGRAATIAERHCGRPFSSLCWTPFAAQIVAPLAPYIKGEYLD